VERIRKHAEAAGEKVRLDVFETNEAWLRYSYTALKSALQIGSSLRLPMHLWPDSSMGTKANLAILADQIEVLSQVEIRQQLESCWHRISEWPGKGAS
jgi:enterochelin esterase-like enzyme